MVSTNLHPSLPTFFPILHNPQSFHLTLSFTSHNPPPHSHLLSKHKLLHTHTLSLSRPTTLSPHTYPTLLLNTLPNLSDNSYSRSHTLASYSHSLNELPPLSLSLSHHTPLFSHSPNSHHFSFLNLNPVTLSLTSLFTPPPPLSLHCHPFVSPKCFSFVPLSPLATLSLPISPHSHPSFSLLTFISLYSLSPNSAIGF